MAVWYVFLSFENILFRHSYMHCGIEISYKKGEKYLCYCFVCLFEIFELLYFKDLSLLNPMSYVYLMKKQQQKI